MATKAMDKKIQTVKNRIVKNLSTIPEMSQEDTLNILKDILKHLEEVIDHYHW